MIRLLYVKNYNKRMKFYYFKVVIINTFEDDNQLFDLEAYLIIL